MNSQSLKPHVPWLFFGCFSAPNDLCLEAVVGRRNNTAPSIPTPAFIRVSELRDSAIATLPAGSGAWHGQLRLPDAEYFRGRCLPFDVWSGTPLCLAHLWNSGYLDRVEFVWYWEIDRKMGRDGTWLRHLINTK